MEEKWPPPCLRIVFFVILRQPWLLSRSMVSDETGTAENRRLEGEVKEGGEEEKQGGEEGERETEKEKEREREREKGREREKQASKQAS